MRPERGKNAVKERALFLFDKLPRSASFIAFEGADQRAGVTISYKFRGLPHRFSLCEEAFGGLQAHGVKVFQQAVACQVLILVAEGGKVPPQPVGNEGDVQERVLVIFADIALHLRHLAGCRAFPPDLPVLAEV